jgi:putative acetyltransferase
MGTSAIPPRDTGALRDPHFGKDFHGCDTFRPNPAGYGPRMTSIRPEQPDDLPWIHAINALAFGQPDEAELVDQLRDDGDVLASLVAVGDGDEIDGHILFSRLGLLFDDGTSAEAAALAPVAVRPDRQRQGIGKALVRAGITACKAQQLPAIIVLGHPEYYPKFGFSAALARNLRSPFPGDAFMALELIPDMLRGKRGAVRYAKAFGLPVIGPVIEEPA